MKIVRLSLLLSIFIPTLTFAGPTDPIADNSFLIEEAYNQEAGVVQHINAYQYNQESKDWEYTFTQEWPLFSQDHQLSYTIPVLDPGEGVTSGIGDVLLNYRYQLLSDDRVAFSPRLSLVLPTGDEKKDRGSDTLGFEVNLPMSVTLTDSVVMHWNLGATILPNANGSGGPSSDLTNFFYGASVVYHFSPVFDALLEVVGSSDESVGEVGSSFREDSFVVSPGVRWAVNFPSGLQIVPGVGVPIGVGPSEGEYGFIGYLSFEHPF